MFWMHDADGQARSRDDGQRHARRPGGHHRPLCLRAALGRRGHRHPRRRARHRGDRLHRAPGHRRSGRRHLASTASAASSACSASASSPTASTAPAGTGTTTTRRRASTASSTTSARVVSSSSSRASAPLTHLHGDLRRRLRLLQAPEQVHEGRHPPDEADGARPAWTCRRWASSPTRSSWAATARPRGRAGRGSARAPS